jgi:hypothetical protein
MADTVKTEVASEPKVRPTRPDEETFKANLAQAEKEHAAVQEKLVCALFGFNCSLYTVTICQLALSRGVHASDYTVNCCFMSYFQHSYPVTLC